MTVPTEVRIAAFDYDDTIIDGQSGMLLARYLLGRGLLPVASVLRLLWWAVRYKLRLPHCQHEAREAVFSALVEWQAEDVLRLMREFHDEVLVPRIRRDALAEIERRRAEGCVLLIVSASFSCIIEPACDRLGMDGFVATRMERDEAGAYTGRVDGEVTEGAGKAAGIERFGNERFGAGCWELAYAYGDHHTDRNMLEMASEAFCVDADMGLSRLADKRGWSMLDWR